MYTTGREYLYRYVTGQLLNTHGRIDSNEILIITIITIITAVILITNKAYTRKRSSRVR